MKRFDGEIWFSTIKGKLTARGEFFDEKQNKRRQVWRTVKTTKKEAKNAVITEIERILNEKTKSPQDYTFAEFAEYYKSTHAVPAKFRDGVKYEGKKSWKIIRVDIKYLTEYFGKKKIKDIRRDDVLKYRTKRLETPVRVVYYEKVELTEAEKASLPSSSRKRFKKVKKERVSSRAVASVNHELRTFSAMMRVAFNNDWLDRQFNMSGVISSAGENRRERIPTTEEFERLLTEARREPKRWHLAALMLLISEVGARPIECFNLKWNDIDLDARTVTLVSDKGKRRRIDKMFMTEKLYEELKNLPRFNEFVLGGIKSVKRAWNNIKSKTGIDVDIYAIRHLYSVRVDALLISDTLKMRMTRHTQRRTADRYRHYSDEDLKSVAEQLESHLPESDAVN